MKKLLLVIFAAALTACSSLKVSYDFDGQADFSKYKTYAFTEESKKLPVEQLNRERILRAIETELAAKGFTKSDDNPDAWIDLHVKAEEKMEATATTSGAGIGYGGGYYGRYGYGGGFATTHIDYNKYVEGTLFVDFVDRASQKIVWQGRATKTIDQDASAEKREQNINYAVKQIFTKYPPAKKK
jgi:hypothetical protein